MTAVSGRVQQPTGMADSEHAGTGRGRAISEDMRVLASRRLREAQVLLSAGEWSGAYYLGGYAVECGLKACILKVVKRFHMPDKDTINKGHTHSLTELVKLAGLEQHRQITAGSNPKFEAY
ncbi:hypothetical protein [Nocardia sp. NPDC047038]|uniref:hypothetical protein n=1 Tax=Nocardia sp. NPDC047038 TaxID=3154338 RepID=UPI0033CB9B4F